MGEQGKRSSGSNIKTLLKLVKVDMRDVFGPSVCLTEVTLTSKMACVSTLILDCTSRSYLFYESQLS